MLLVWIGVKLLAPDEDGHGDIQGSDKLLAAIKTIIVADLVMSVDNVIAIAGAAQNAGEHSFAAGGAGPADLHPHHRLGQQLVIKLMARFPMIITLGGMLLGWIAGGMLVTDPAVADPDNMALDAQAEDTFHYAAAWRGAAGAGDRQVHPPRCSWTAHIAGALLVRRSPPKWAPAAARKAVPRWLSAGAAREATERGACEFSAGPSPS